MYFAPLLEHLSGSLIDNAALTETLCSRHSLDQTARSKVRLIYTPAAQPIRDVPVAAEQVNSAKLRRRKILWAGRMDRQKRFDLVIEIARAMSGVDFHCWGKAVLDAAPDLSGLPSNMTIHEPFATYDELPLSDSDGHLYTAAWDGIPTFLIECGALGLPIVASAVGGVPELIDNETGWPVPAGTGTDAYVSALYEMLDAPGEQVARAQNLQ